MIDMLKIVRDVMITVAAVHIAVAYWVVMDAEFVGHWLANVDIAYDSVWSEYVADCDCTQELN
jgi:hypothetical protein